MQRHASQPSSKDLNSVPWETLSFQRSHASFSCLTICSPGHEFAHNVKKGKNPKELLFHVVGNDCSISTISVRVFKT